jgi:hypothetical protein
MSDITDAVKNSTGIISSMVDTANQFADSQGGYENLAKKAVGSYVDAHGGALGTAEHVAHNVVNEAANTLWGAKDWGNAYREAKSGDWWGALKSAAWGAASLGATASLVIPGVGEAVKGADLAAEAARAGGEAVAEATAKDAAEAGAKDVAESGVVDEGTSGVKKARKTERNVHRAREVADVAGRIGNFLSGTGKAEVQPQGLQQPRIY